MTIPNALVGETCIDYILTCSQIVDRLLYLTSTVRMIATTVTPVTISLK